MFCLCCTVPEYKAEKQEAGVCTGFLFCGSANQAKHPCFLSMLQDLMQIIQTFSDDQFPKDGVASFCRKIENPKDTQNLDLSVRFRLLLPGKGAFTPRYPMEARPC